MDLNFILENLPLILAGGGVLVMFFPKLAPYLALLKKLVPSFAPAASGDEASRAAAWQTLSTHVGKLKCAHSRAVADKALTELAPIVLRACDYQPVEQK